MGDQAIDNVTNVLQVVRSRTLRQLSLDTISPDQQLPMISSASFNAASQPTTVRTQSSVRITLTEAGPTDGRAVVAFLTVVHSEKSEPGVDYMEGGNASSSPRRLIRPATGTSPGRTDINVSARDDRDDSLSGLVESEYGCEIPVSTLEEGGNIPHPHSPTKSHELTSPPSVAACTADHADGIIHPSVSPDRSHSDALSSGLDSVSSRGSESDSSDDWLSDLPAAPSSIIPAVGVPRAPAASRIAALLPAERAKQLAVDLAVANALAEAEGGGGLSEDGSVRSCEEGAKVQCFNTRSLERNTGIVGSTREGIGRKVVPSRVSVSREDLELDLAVAAMLEEAEAELSGGGEQRSAHGGIVGEDSSNCDSNVLQVRITQI